MKRPSFAALLATALLLSAAGCSQSRPSAVVTVDATKRFQTIEAWEATAKMWEFDKKADRFDGSWLPVRDPILTALILDGGISRLRLEIRSGAENPVDWWSQFRSSRIGYLGFKSHFYEKINDNDDPRTLNPAGIQFAELDFRVENLILPAMRIAAQHGKPMSFILCYVDFMWTQSKGTLSHARNPEEYAELIAATYAHLKQKYGLTPDALEIILEPDNSDDWRGRQIGEAIVAVSRRLEQQRVGKVPIIAPSVSVGRRAPTYFEELAKVLGAAERVSVLSYHRYGGVFPQETLMEVATDARRIGARTAMLEYTHASVNDLFDDLTVGNVSSWQKYSIVGLYKDDGDTAPGNMLRAFRADGGRFRIGILPASAGLAQVFRSVPPGSVRIGATATGATVRAVAFRKPDGAMTVAVKANKGVVARIWDSARARIDALPPLPPGDAERVRIDGLNPGAYRVERVNGSTGVGAIRCRIDVKAGIPTEIRLGEGDVATVSGGINGERLCASDVTEG